VWYRERVAAIYLHEKPVEENSKRYRNRTNKYAVSVSNLHHANKAFTEVPERLV